MIDPADHLPLVRAVLRGFLAEHPWLDGYRCDLNAAGNLGLVEAAKSFDPCRDCAFSTFAWVVIRRAMAREAKKLCPAVTIVSIDRPAAGSGFTLEETVTDDRNPTAADIETVTPLAAAVCHAMQTLHPDRRRVLAELYGLSTVSTTATVSDLAARWDVDTATVHRRLVRAMAHIRKAARRGRDKG